MISCSPPIKDPQHSRYYVEMTQSDYYANRHEEAGYWTGKGAKLLGLSGPVLSEQLRNLFEGYSPDGKTKLVQNAGRSDRLQALDFVPSPHKSVSVRWAMSEPEERATIERIHDEAVQAVVDFFEENAAFTRRGKGGAIVEPVALAVACITHCTSREMDMQIHTHLVIPNIGIRKDGTSGSLHNHAFFELRKQADVIYQTHLALGFSMELGWKLEPEGQAFRVVGVPENVCKHFSKRHTAIVEYKKAHQLEGPLAGIAAAMATRPKKQHKSREELFSSWHREGNSIGWGPEQARKLARDKRALKAARSIIAQETPVHSSEPGGTKQTQPLNQPTVKDSAKSRDHLADDIPGAQHSQSTSEQADWESKSWTREQMRKPEERSFKQMSKDRCVIKHRRWGEVLWKQNLGIIEIRIQMKRLQPKAPGWNKVSKLALPAVRIIPWRIKLFDAVAPHKRPQPKVLWRKGFLFAELRIQKQQVFPKTPAWSLGQKVVLPRLSLGLKSSEPPKVHKAKKSNQNQTQGMGHSH